MRELSEKITNLKIYQKLEKTFNDEITHEDYVLHTFLLWSNIFLSIIAILEIFLHKSETFYHYAHIIELIFGIIFLFEFILRLIFSYFKNSVFFQWKLLLQLLIIVSLIAPHLLGNLAILRLVRSMKILKIFILRREQKELAGEKIKPIKLPKKIHKINCYIIKKMKKSEKKINNIFN